MNAVARRPKPEAQTAVVVSTEAGTLMAVISRAASDPTVDVDKLERLMGLYERLTDRTAKAAYAAALATMQPLLPVIGERGQIVVPAKDGKAGHSTAYAKWEDINDGIRPVLAAHGFALSFRVGQAQDGKITVTGILSHRDGHSEETMITLMHDSSGSKNAVQAVGSSTSYGKRYTAMALLNITTRGEDDDGKKAGEPATISGEQLETLLKLADDVSADKGKFCRFFKVDSFPAIPAARYQEAYDALRAKAVAK